MIFSRWHRKCRLVLCIVAVLVCFELWSASRNQTPKPKYDLNHLRLLQAYKASRIKKHSTGRVISLSSNSNDSINDSIAALRPKNQIQVNKSFNYIPLNHVATADLNLDISDDGHFPTRLDDIFIAVKTTKSYHKTRLPLLLDTWIPLARQSTYIISDTDDNEISSNLASGHFLQSSCSKSHFRTDLVCKVSTAYQLFIRQLVRWFCVCDDDTYLNIPNLLKLLQRYDHTADWYIGKPSLKFPFKLIFRGEDKAFWFHTGGAGYCISRSLALKMTPHTLDRRLMSIAEELSVPDDVVVGYVINSLLGVEATRIGLFHSHLEPLWSISTSELHNQISLSYGVFESSSNKTATNLVDTGTLIPTLPISIDPTRLISVHCHLYPHARECQKYSHLFRSVKTAITQPEV